MGHSNINSELLVRMIEYGASNLSHHKETINKLNVFPVPDGDTGTNMNLSMQSGLKAVQAVKGEDLPTIMKQYVHGLLMGARGNSGVILSQLFKGFQVALEGKSVIDATSFVQALEGGIDTAYRAVTNPVEGTILTVAHDAASAARNALEQSNDITEIMEQTVDAAKRSLTHTPELLPILKEVGVVDSGGKGLLVIYEGFLAALKNEDLDIASTDEDTDTQIEREHEKAVQSFVSADAIEYGYCTEFFIELKEDKLKEHPFHEAQFRDILSEYGDSLLIAAADEIVKIHIHTEYPGKVMTIAQNYGDLINIDIENMRKQHEALMERPQISEKSEPAETAVLAVAMGSGMKEVMSSIGATTVITGGQTMNPSTEDILQAIDAANAETVYILPNNKNIILAANQAKALTEKQVVIIPTKSMPQGISALFVYDETVDKETNEQNMNDALLDVKTGQVTYATRDTLINGIKIDKNAYIAMDDDTIVYSEADKMSTLKQLLNHLVEEEDEILTIFFGKDVTDDEQHHVKSFVDETFDIEVEYHIGNQPLYPFILMVE